MSPRSAWLLQEEIVPRLKSAVPQTVSFIGSEDAEELVQDSIAMAAKLLHNVDKAKKKVTPRKHRLLHHPAHEVRQKVNGVLYG